MNFILLDFLQFKIYTSWMYNRGASLSAMPILSFVFQLLDGPGGLLSEGYFMGGLLYGNDSIDITLSGVLE